MRKDLLLALIGAVVFTGHNAQAQGVTRVCTESIGANGSNNCTEVSQTNPFPVSPAVPSSGVTPSATAALASSFVAKASAGLLYGWSVTSGASAGFVLIFNSTSAPVDGAVTPIDCIAIPANATSGRQLSPPEAYSTGITLVFSTTGCFTKTASATAYFRGDVQ